MQSTFFDANQRIIKNIEENMPPEKIIFYTTNCPRCQVLKKKMDALGIKYKI